MMYRRLFPLWVLLPSLLFLVVFTYLPLFSSVVDSLYDSRLSTHNPPFVGLQNIIRLFRDAVFWQALGNNFLYMAMTIIPGIGLALLLAVALWENTVVNRWLRAAFFLPMIIPLVSAATLWLFVFMPGLGLMDFYLGKLLGAQNHNYLGNTQSALLALSVVGIWKFAGYYMLFFLAGLQSIPSALREAAVMEGASSLQRFFYLTLPMLQPTLSLVFITAFIYSFTQVDHVSVMTQGGPNNASTVLLFYIQQLANDTHDWGKASAATFITLLMLFAFSVVNIRVLERGSHHE